MIAEDGQNKAITVIGRQTSAIRTVSDHHRVHENATPVSAEETTAAGAVIAAQHNPPTSDDYGRLEMVKETSVTVRLTTFIAYSRVQRYSTYYA